MTLFIPGHVLSLQSGCLELVAQSCLILFDLMSCSLPDSSVHGILQARILERVAISFSITLHRCNSLTVNEQFDHF